MIQEIPYTYDPAYKKPEMSDYLLHYEYNKVMLLKEKEGYCIPVFQDLLFEEDFREKAYSSIGDRGYYLVDDMKVPEFGGFVLRLCRPSGTRLSGFCRYYRKPDLPLEGAGDSVVPPSSHGVWNDGDMVCPSCGHTEYPKISPAVIVAIQRG